MNLITGVANFIGFHLAKRILFNGYSILGIYNISLCIGIFTEEDKSYPFLFYFSEKLSDYGFSISIANDIFKAIKKNET
tara:strand:- start:155 stop:391 length:237 start_codon:yes stop_codon:yes gene_type:complete